MRGAAYGARFYASRHQDTKYAADRILGLVLDLVHPASVVDVGCGVGTWLRAAREHGAAEVFGFEGEWLDRTRLVLEPELIECRDLEEPLRLEQRFDLALCLEVAEHLSPARGEAIVRDLVRMADAVLFSAAIPGQGGSAHRNERWQSYWAGLFAGHAYDVFDVVRPAIWADERIPFWYRQNTLMYARRGSASAMVLRQVPATVPVLDAVHPRLYLNTLHPGPLTTTRLAIRAVKRVFGWAPPLPD